MNFLRDTRLIVRRTAAFGADLAILLLGLSFLCVVLLSSGDRQYGCAWNGLFIGIILSYFGLSEAMSSGQTLGKRLLGIRLRSPTGRPVTFYQSFGRIAVLLLLAEAATTVYLLLGVAGIFPRSDEALSIVGKTVSTIWPISLVLGRGRLCLHDLLFQTEVVNARGQSNDHASVSISWYVPTCILTSLLTAVGFVSLCAHTGANVVTWFDRLSASEKREFMELGGCLDDLALGIENGPEFLSGDRMFLLFGWDQRTWKHWPVRRACIAVPDAVREGRIVFNGHVHYVIHVTRRGISSFVFQSHAAEKIAERGMRRGFFVTIEFVHESRVWVFAHTVTKRYMAFAYASEEDRHSVIEARLEPDYCTVIDVKFAWGKWVSGIQKMPPRVSHTASAWSLPRLSRDTRGSQ